MLSPSRLGSATLLIWGTVLAVPAQGQSDDGVYGRLDGDMVLSAGLGLASGPGTANDPQGPAVMLDLRARFLDAAGLFVAPGWNLSGGGHASVGLEVRPLWPARFLLGGSTHSEWLDLFIDSAGFELGTVITPLGGGRAGVGLLLGLGLGVPLILPSTFGQGLHLRFSARYMRAEASDQAAPPGGLSTWQLSATLIMRFGVRAGLAGREPPRYRLD